MSTQQKIILCFFSFFMGIVFLTESAEKFFYPCYRLIKEPILDGDIRNDPAWQNIPKATGFLILGDYLEIALKQTSFKMGYDSNSLFIGIECEEPEIDKIEAKNKDMGRLWTEDSVEIFLFPKGSKNYYQFIVNTIGSRWNGMRPEGKISLKDWQAVTSQTKNGYSIEIKIPFEVFGKIPKNNETWTGNICRNIWTSEVTHTSWAHMRFNFHEPENFANIVFKEKCSLEEAKTIENNLQRSFKDLFREEIKNNLSIFSQYQSELISGMEMSSLKEEAEILFKKYERMKAQFSSLDTLSLQEISMLLKKSSELPQEGDKLKGKILLESFFK